MNTRSTQFLLVAFAGALSGSALVAASAPAGAASDVPTTVADIFSRGKVSFTARVRYETVEQGNRRNADAFTFRTAFGFTTAPLHGFSTMLELEDVTPLDGSDYAPAPNFSPNADSRAVIADPEGTEVNQAWLAYTSGPTTLKAGRLNLVLDNARFVGNVGWRQNQQTFGGVVLQHKSIEHFAFTYSYLGHINRIFGDDIPDGNWQSNSHLLNAGYAGLPVGTLTGYAYLLDFDNAAAMSCATYGLSLTGTQNLSDTAKLNYRAEIATQSDYGASPLDYSTTYLLGEIGVAAARFSGSVGYEELGTDNGASFRTPLATLHAFNGWAEVFLTTPADGLRDIYVKAGLTLTNELSLLGFYHQFETDRGADLGGEFDVQLAYKFSQYITGLIKYAAFDSDNVTLPDVDKFWAQVEFVF